MISHASFQEQIIDTLQVYGNLLLLVTAAEMRESSWQGTEFIYPNIRVDVRTQIPEGNGPCRETISIENFAVIAMSEGASSLECEQICFQIIECLFGAQIEDTAASQGPNWRCETVNLIQFNAPRRMAERIWRGELVFRGRVKETS